MRNELRVASCAVLLAACTDVMSLPERVVEPQFVSGGTTVSDASFASQWPFAAAIFSYSTQLSFFCTGSVIAQRWIVTAGHCVNDARLLVQSGRAIYVGVGARDITAGMRFVRADDFTAPPEYVPGVFGANDIGLIRLVSDAGTAEAALPWAGTPAVPTVRAAGWGDTGFGFAVRLQTISLTVTQVEDGFLMASGGGASLCSGDSGGPTLDGAGTLIAVNSFVTGSCGASGVESGHATLAEQLPWIALTSGIAPPQTDALGPVASGVAGEPVAANAIGSIVAAVDEATTGGALIAAATLTLNGGSPIPMNPVDGAFDASSEQVSASFTAPALPGLYDACVTGTDEHGNVGEPSCTLVAVYDPAAGFATGAGWIAAGPEPTDRAFFAFVSRYRKGASLPDGNTQFSFQGAGLDFRSSAYDWLIVKANGGAQFKGSGTIAGEAGAFSFMLWAGDYDDGDTFRIRIWHGADENDIVYDNGSDQPLLAGNIVVNRK